MVKPKQPRFYIPAHVRQVVNEISRTTGMSPGEVVEGALAHLLNDHARTGRVIGDPAIRAMVERATAAAKRAGRL